MFKRKKKNEIPPKQRIFDAAVELFARKGFGATGVREIACRAKVNLAMINYYYGSKSKVLQAIIGEFFSRYAEAVSEALTRDVPVEERIHDFFHRAVNAVREHHQLFRVAVTEMRFDRPELADFKARLVRERILPVVAAVVERDFHRLNPRLKPEVVGPALAGMVMAHFLTAAVFARVMGVELDDAFYAQFPDQLAELALYGLFGIRPDGETAFRGLESGDNCKQETP